MLKAMLADALYIRNYYSQKLDTGSILFNVGEHDDAFLSAVIEFACNHDLAKTFKHIYIALDPLQKQTAKEKLRSQSSSPSCKVSLLNFGSLKHLKALTRAKYLISDRPLPEQFIKKQGQVCITLADDVYLERIKKSQSQKSYISGDFLRSLLFSDILASSHSKQAKEVLSSCSVSELYTGTVICPPQDSSYSFRNTLDPLISFALHGKHNEIELSKLQASAKTKTLMYIADMAYNGLSASLLALLNIIDRDNVYLTFQSKLLDKHPERIERLPQNSLLFPMEGNFKCSFEELFICVLFFKFNLNGGWIQKRLDRLYQRECLRFFCGAKFDRVVHFSGYGRNTINLFQRMSAQRVIFVHNDMLAEIASRKNQHLPTLKNAYSSYDKVAAVAEAVIAPAKQISERKDNITVVNNAFDYEKILRLGKEEPQFDENTISTIDLDALKVILSQNKTIKIINIGRFSAQKGHIRLIDAFERFCEEGFDAQLLIIGGHGEDYAATVKYAETRKHSQRIALIQNVSNPFAILKRCDVFVLSSLYESLGLVVLEANTLGVPPFSTDNPGTKEFMQQYGGALFPNSEEGILQGMRAFAAGEISCMNFDAKKHNEAVKEQYKKLFEQPS